MPGLTPVGVHGQSRQSRCRAGHERGPGSGPQARPRSLRITRSAGTGGHRRRPSTRSRSSAEALYVGVDSFFNTDRESASSRWRRARLPAIYYCREFVEAGGLMTYGPNYPELYRRAADYVDQHSQGRRSQPICRSSSRPNSSSSSTSRPPRRSASKFRRPLLAPRRRGDRMRRREFITLLGGAAARGRSRRARSSRRCR